MEDSADGKPKKSGARHCCICNQKRAALKRPKTLEQVISPTRIVSLCVLVCFVIEIEIEIVAHEDLQGMFL